MFGALCLFIVDCKMGHDFTKSDHAREQGKESFSWTEWAKGKWSPFNGPYVV